MSISMEKPYDQKKRLRLLHIGGAVIMASFLVMRPVYHSEEIHGVIETTGLALVVFCILGRLWSTLYIGGRKNSELVVTGPYSMTRNPLYFFSCIGAAGIGLMAGSLLWAAVLFAFAYFALAKARNGEEKFLAGRYGEHFTAYAARTPRFWPKPALYVDHAFFECSTKALKRTFFDCLWFMLLFPVLEGIEQLQALHMLPVWITAY